MSVLVPNYLHHFNQHSAQRLTEATPHARIHLYSNRDFILREVHHVGHVAGEETAVTVGSAAAVLRMITPRPYLVSHPSIGAETPSRTCGKRSAENASPS